jgi:two-component system, NtrC family, sensor kinase
MRLSLVTRVFAGYFLMFCLLAGVVVYSVLAMHRMQSDVTIVKQGLFPISARLYRLNRDLGKAMALLEQEDIEQAAWVKSFLPQIQPFEHLEAIAAHLADLSRQGHLGLESQEFFATVSKQVTSLVRGDKLLTDLLVPLQQAGIVIQGRTDRERFSTLTEEFIRRNHVPLDRLEYRTQAALKHALTNATRRIGKEVRQLEASSNLAINNAWSSARDHEESAVRVALVMGVAALLVTVAVLILLLSWLRPLGELQKVARRIATGDYDHRASIRRNDEVGQLAEELNKMALRLKEREEMIRNQSDELLRSDRFSTIGKMSTQIAHEIRNPLNALGLKLELMDENVVESAADLPSTLHDELRKAIETAGKEIDRLREITDYYLKFAKFPKVEKEAVDLHTVLTDVLGFYGEEARRKGISIDDRIDRPLRTRADSNLLRHALANLLKNAIEATSERAGDGVISLEAFRDGNKIRVSLRDNGSGIPRNQIRHIFEPFFSTKRSGTGLGLTLVQQVVSEHGGTITCASTEGEGTVFRIALPE